MLCRALGSLALTRAQNPLSGTPFLHSVVLSAPVSEDTGPMLSTCLPQ